VIKRDYILRLIERAAEFILKAAGLRKEGKHHEAAQTLGEGFKSLLGIDANLAAAIAVEDLVSLLGRDPGKLVACARLLEETPETRLRALTLYLEVHLLPGRAEYLNRTQDVHRLLETISTSGEELPPEVEQRLKRFEASPRT
jgi:hypothetical protein